MRVMRPFSMFADAALGSWSQGKCDRLSEPVIQSISPFRGGTLVLLPKVARFLVDLEKCHRKSSAKIPRTARQSFCAAFPSTAANRKRVRLFLGPSTTRHNAVMTGLRVCDSFLLPDAAAAHMPPRQNGAAALPAEPLHHDLLAKACDSGPKRSGGPSAVCRRQFGYIRVFRARGTS